MFCPNCGNQVPEGYQFCSYCGARFDSGYVNQQPQYTPQPAPRKGVNLVGVVAAAAAVLVVGGIAAGLFLGGRNGSTPDKNPEKPNSDAQVQDEDEDEQADAFSGWMVSVKREFDQEGSLRTSSEYSYDLLGRLVKEQRYDKTGTATQHTKYVYDLTGGYTMTNYISKSGRVCTVDQFNADGEQVLRIVYNEDGSEGLRHECVFDEHGRLISKDSVEDNGDFVGRAEYTYDENGNEILSVIYISGVEQQRTVKAYDEKGNLIREEWIPNKEVDPYSDPDIYEYTYDERNNLLKKQHIFRDNPYDHEEYFYDEENRLILLHRYIDHLSGWEEMSRFEQYIYNEEGLLISEGRGSSYDVSKGSPEDRAFTERTTYEYNAEGQVTAELYYVGPNLRSRKDTEYNEDGQPALIRHTNADGLLTGETIFTYDGSGNLLSQCYTDENNEIGDTDPSFTMYEYTYDSHGNMTSEKYYYNRETTKYHYEYEYTFIP